MLTEKQQSIIDSIKNQFEELNKPSSSKGSLVDTNTLISDYQKKQERRLFKELRKRQVDLILQQKVQDMRDRLATDLWDLNLEVEWERASTKEDLYYRLRITHKFNKNHDPLVITVEPQLDVKHRQETNEEIPSTDSIWIYHLYKDKYVYSSIEEYCNKCWHFGNDIKKMYEDNAHLSK